MIIYHIFRVHLQKLVNLETEQKQIPINLLKEKIK